MENDFCLGSEVEKLVPSAEHCKELKNRGWKSAKCFYWYEAYTNVYALAQAEDIGIKEEATAIPAPTAEELLRAFYKLYPSIRNVIIAPNKETKGWRIYWSDQADISFAVAANTLANALARAYLRVTRKEKNKHV